MPRDAPDGRSATAAVVAVGATAGWSLVGPSFRMGAAGGVDLHRAGALAP